MRLMTDKQRKRKVREVRDRLLLESEHALAEMERGFLIPGTEEHRNAVGSAAFLVGAYEELRYDAEREDDER